MCFVHNNPEAEAQKPLSVYRERAYNDYAVTLLGFCLKVIVNETRINLEKTTSSVLSVINIWF